MNNRRQDGERGYSNESMELISSDSLSVCEITLRRCDKEDAPECGSPHDGRNTDRSDSIYSGGLPGRSKNAIVAYAETQGGSDEDSLEETEDTALPETDGNVLEDETTADEASSAETEADIRTETENTETKEESITEPAAGSENADADHGPEEAAETETAAAADEVSGITQAEPETEVSGKPGYRRQQKRPSWQRNLQEKRSRGIPKATTMFFSGSFRRKPETATSKDVSWWQT